MANAILYFVGFTLFSFFILNSNQRRKFAHAVEVESSSKPALVQWDKVEIEAACEIRRLNFDNGSHAVVRFYCQEGVAKRFFNKNGKSFTLKPMLINEDFPSLNWSVRRDDILVETERECMDLYDANVQEIRRTVENKPESNAASVSADFIQQLTENLDGKNVYGRIVEFGEAEYPFSKGEDAQPSRSYFLKLRSSKGNEFDVWGMDIKRALRTSGAVIGQKICLTKHGKHMVTVPCATGTRQVMKNLFSIKAVD